MVERPRRTGGRGGEPFPLFSAAAFFPISPRHAFVSFLRGSLKKVQAYFPHEDGAGIEGEKLMPSGGASISTHVRIAFFPPHIPLLSDTPARFQETRGGGHSCTRTGVEGNGLFRLPLLAGHGQRGGGAAKENAFCPKV